MRKHTKIIFEKYQVRKSKKQKETFAIWLEQYLNTLGYKLEKDAYSHSGTNLIVGHLETAKIVLTAHYDTQPNAIIPFVTLLNNWFVYILSQLLMLLPIIILGLIINLLVSGDGVVLPITVLLYSIQMIAGFANKHTANDNTSGVITLLTILEDLPKAARDDVCVVFLDQEEIGLIGSAKFNQKHKKILQDKPVINYDCVANGDHFIFVTNKQFRASNINNILENICQEAKLPNQKSILMSKSTKIPYMSDQLSFKNSVGIVATHKMSVLGYYLSRIHTSLDIIFDNENIEILADITLKSIAKL